MRLPSEDGYTFLAALRAAGRAQSLPAVPAVAVTAFARVEDRERALALALTLMWPSLSTRKN
jgi:CheY-like chemotaxis protein